MTTRRTHSTTLKMFKAAFQMLPFSVKKKENKASLISQSTYFSLNAFKIIFFFFKFMKKPIKVRKMWDSKQIIRKNKMISKVIS